MTRERSPKRDKAKQMLLESSGMMKLKNITVALFVGETLLNVALPKRTETLPEIVTARRGHPY